MPHGPPQEVVTQGAGSNVAILSGDLSRHVRLLALRECSCSTGVDHSLEWASTICGDNVHGAADRAARRHLREGRAGLRCNLVHHIHRVLALAFGLAQAIGGDVGLLEDGGVFLSLAVGTGAWDHATLDTESGSVATCIAGLWIWSATVTLYLEKVERITYSYSDLAVSRDGCHQGEDESSAMHFEKVKGQK